MSQSTGVQTHGVGLTGVRDVVSTDIDPTVIIVQQNNVDDEGEQDWVLTDDDETQGESDQAGGLTFNAEGMRRSTRVHRAPSSYMLD